MRCQGHFVYSAVIAIESSMLPGIPYGATVSSLSSTPSGREACSSSSWWSAPMAVSTEHCLSGC